MNQRKMFNAALLATLALSTNASTPQSVRADRCGNDQSCLDHEVRMEEMLNNDQANF
jgi:hypothetical protein